MVENKILYALLLVNVVGLIQASVIVSKAIECECHNATAPEFCKDRKIQCEVTDPDKPNYCFVLWTINNVTGGIDVSMKGCFTNNDMCDQTMCIDNTTEPKRQYNFCCCKGDMCNKEHRWIPTTTKATEIPAPPPPEPNTTVGIIWICLAALVVVLLIAGGVFYLLYRPTQLFKEIPTSEPDISGSSLTLNSPRQIRLIEEKAHGRFGSVWRGQYKDEDVAVKIFPLSNKNSWQTEQEIFKLSRMKHANILEYIGVEKRSDTPPTVFWLITSYHTLGSLCDYLKGHTVTWTEMCKIAESMAKGLAHLHDELPATKTEGMKPAVAHRDFKSKNVLLKSDLTACIADFGLALIFEPGKPCGDAHGQVGTRRYMAPEVLEGAINFTRDAFLRIDVYACGLVLWELVSRCTAHDGLVSEYKLPFEAEIGLHTGVDIMQEHVVTKKVRPKILEVWRKHSGLNSICDTMEECWDHDAEARLSASCIVERIAQHTQQTQAAPKQLVVQSNEIFVNQIV